MEEKHAIEPKALAEQLVKDDLAAYLLDSRTLDELIDWIYEDTAIPKHYLKLALRLVTPLIVKGGKKASAWGGGLLVAKGQEWLAGWSHYEKLANWLTDFKIKLDSKARDRQILEDIRTGKRPVKAGADLSTVSLEIQFQLKGLEGIEEILTLLKRQPPLELPHLKAVASRRLVYSAQRVPFVGRKQELDAIHGFLYSDEPLSWWLVTGSGGQGKSRLALETCLRYGGGWQTGFLNIDADFKSWHDWQPDSPTLMVIDYAAGKGEAVKNIVTALHNRTEPLRWPVRLLLLERQFEEQQWWTDLMPHNSGGAVVEENQFGVPMPLVAMSEDDIWETICFILNDKKHPIPGRAVTMGALKEIDDEFRPLYAAMVAEAILVVDDIRGWGKTDLLDWILAREESEFWKPAGVTEKDKNLLALATMVQGLPRDFLEPLAKVDLFPVLGGEGDQKFMTRRYEAMTGQSAKETLAPLEPDIVGEYFVLEHLKPDEDSDIDLAEVFRQLAWEIDLHDTAQFLLRAGRDFTSHSTLTLLYGPALDNSVQRLAWSHISVGLMSFYNDSGRSDLSEKVLDGIWRVHEEHPGGEQHRAVLADALFMLMTIHGMHGELLKLRMRFDQLVAFARRYPEDSVVELTVAKAGYSLVVDYRGRKQSEEALSVLIDISGALKSTGFREHFRQRHGAEKLELFMAALDSLLEDDE